MRRLFLIISVLTGIVVLATMVIGDQGSHRIVAGDVSGGYSATAIAGIGQISNQLFFETISKSRFGAASENEGCDASNGHSCAPHFVSSGQTTAAFAVDMKSSRLVVISVAPDGRKALGLFRPPIKYS